MDHATKTAKSELLKDLLEAGRGGSESAGLNTRIRAMVSEVLQMSPLKLANMLSASAKESVSSICHRAAEYTVDRIERQDLDPAQRAAAVKETTDLFSEFLSELKLELMRQFVEVENYIFTHTYMVDEGLFAEGFIRFPHQEGVNYTQPDRAHELGGLVEHAEHALEAQLREIRNLKSEISAIDQVSPRLDELVSWLDTVLASGISERAPEVREIADQVERGVSLLRTRLD